MRAALPSLATAGVAVALAGIGRGGAPWVDAALAGAVLAACIAMPPLCAPAFLAACLVCPFAISTGTQTYVEAPFIVLPLLLAVWALRGPRPRFVAPAPVWAVGALAAVAVAAFALGGRPWLTFVPRPAPLGAQLGGLAVFLGSAGAFVLGAGLLQDVRWLRRTSALFIVLGSLYLTARLVPAVGEATAGLFPAGADGSLFWTWLVALAFALAVLDRSLPRPLRLAVIGVVAAAFHISFDQAPDSVSGWLPALVAIGVVILLRAPRLVFLVGAAAAASLPFLWPILTSLDNRYSLMTRLAAWRIVGEVTRVNPVLGLGPANYHANTSRFPILGWYVPLSSHNTYVDLVAQVGVVGLASFGLLVWVLARHGWNAGRRAGDDFARAYAYGALGGLAGMLAAGLLADWIFPFVYNVTLRGFRASAVAWLLLGGLAAIGNIAPAGVAHGGGRDEV